MKALLTARDLQQQVIALKNTPAGSAFTEILDTLVLRIDTTAFEHGVAIGNVLTYRDSPLPNALAEPLSALVDWPASRGYSLLKCDPSKWSRANEV